MVAFPTPSASSTVALASRRGLATIAPGQVAFARAAPVPGRSVLKVTGRDAPKFLNGLAAVRIPETFEGRPFYGAFLHAQVRPPKALAASLGVLREPPVANRSLTTGCFLLPPPLTPRAASCTTRSSTRTRPPTRS